jgi:RNA polymerase sigma-70 factor, ECF subfamily
LRTNFFYFHRWGIFRPKVESFTWEEMGTKLQTAEMCTASSERVRPLPISLTRHERTNTLRGERCDFSDSSCGVGNKIARGAVLALGGKDNLQRFEQAMMPHMDAAYNLARWLTRNEHDAQDIVQEAYLRAFKFFEGFHGLDARAWLLTTVRNTCYTWLERNRRNRNATSFDEEIHTVEEDAMNPSSLALKSGDIKMVRESLEELPEEFREIIVLRDLEELSYKQIAEVIKAPLGTVMSRLARARGKLKRILCSRLKEKP